MSYAFLEEKPGGDAYRDPAGEAEAEGPGVSRSCRRGIPEDHHGRNRKLRQMLEGQDGAPAAVEEPMLPVPAERFLTQPVRTNLPT